MRILLTTIVAAALLTLLGNICPVMAAGTVDGVIGTVKPPAAVDSIAGKTGEEKLGTVLSTLITLIFAASAVAFVFMIVWGAFQWLVSGGDKEALASARKRIVNAIIGIALLALSFVIITLIGILTGFKFYAGQEGAAKVYQENSVTKGLGFDEFTRREQEKQSRSGGN